jgi:ribosomal 30S subunit maturation factor RimM
VCVHVECSCILGVVDDLFSMGSIDAYMVQKGGTKEAYHMTALALIGSDSQ